MTTQKAIMTTKLKTISYSFHWLHVYLVVELSLRNSRFFFPFFLLQKGYYISASRSKIKNKQTYTYWRDTSKYNRQRTRTGAWVCWWISEVSLCPTASNSFWMVFPILFISSFKPSKQPCWKGKKTIVWDKLVCRLF